MLKQLKTQKKAIENIKNGINITENKTILMMRYIDAQVSQEFIKIFADTIDLDIDKYEESAAFTWAILGYNYQKERELTTDDIDRLAKIADDMEYDEEDLMDIDKTHTVFQIWYDLNNLDLN